jgi:hypothetical protein
MGLLVTIGIRALETLFVVGAMGSLVVLVLSGVEDLETLLGSENSATSNET